ncbi:MAG: thiolase family protein [Solirubrobacteraceae bacterium]
MLRDAAITGIAETSLDPAPERSAMSLCIEASLAAIEDAGLRVGDIDGLLCMPPWESPSTRYHILIAEELGLFSKALCESMMMGGASPCAALQLARWAIGAGRCEHVLIVSGEPQLSTYSGVGGVLETFASGAAHNRDYEFPYGVHVPAYYGLLAQRYLHEYGLESRALSPAAVVMRRHAALNPAAQKREPITVHDVEESPLIASPIRRLHCALTSDGAAAHVVSARGASAEGARAVGLIGTGQGHSAYHMGHLVRGDASHDLVRTVCDIATSQAFAEAEIAPADVDVAALYDSFTITLMLQLEDAGLCGRGEAASFIEDGSIELGGTLPVNTHGGLLSCGQPGGAGGMLHVNEVVRQLRGEASGRQVPGAELGLVTSASGVASNFAAAILAGNR